MARKLSLAKSLWSKGGVTIVAGTNLTQTYVPMTFVTCYRCFQIVLHAYIQSMVNNWSLYAEIQDFQNVSGGGGFLTGNIATFWLHLQAGACKILRLAENQRCSQFQQY